jgi:hypothetical protein
MKIIQCIFAFTVLLLHGTNLQASSPDQTNEISEEKLKAAEFVFLGEVQSLELIDSTLIDPQGVPRRFVKVGMLLSHYWKPEKVNARSVFIYLNFSGDYGIPKIRLGYRLFVLGEISSAGVLYARSGSSAFYDYSTRMETLFERDPVGSPQSFADGNLMLINKALGQPRTPISEENEPKTAEPETTGRAP